ncbi:hypothetical protein GCM10011583_38600 [Streptomyces camponoticapitis]|uniref:Secreted protein n=1 Tax=Streptomyces camponoticapitis TaxID=1616125 RepID=A0ABQ2EAD3_9ACTN|nr:hypothetical protein GCM10011583_38600 [Streptomyces camponoticapitis]
MYRKARKAAASLTAAVLIVAGLAVTAVVRDESPPPAARTSAADVLGVDRVAVDADSDDAHEADDSHDTNGADGPDGVRDRRDGRDKEREREPFGASCRTAAEGSVVTAFCHNPYPETDRVQLHIECARWWDVDSDSAPAEARPAGYVRLTGRCWKEIESAWVSHARVVP